MIIFYEEFDKLMKLQLKPTSINKGFQYILATRFKIEGENLDINSQSRNRCFLKY
ncbi:hypothetical protein KFK09_019122 [Dendrobium nobile]|uniref:Uncharacterized protein n=1 Tax=Dendrobium nobile TaxID=94219 RepID=A0A8T3AXY4_DENNO|nr:hypothetical protein KFK09_019122 [Dendrobium nobile]